jgi:hypothetical protein
LRFSRRRNHPDSSSSFIVAEISCRRLPGRELRAERV